MESYSDTLLNGDTDAMQLSVDACAQIDKALPAIRFIDLFAGLGGTRIGFEQACDSLQLARQCVFTSELKNHAIEAYQKHFGGDRVHGDITAIEPSSIPDFDYLLAGFPCQPFSAAGKRNGFLDRRGGLFFTIVDILIAKQPKGFLLENVEGLMSHNQGETFQFMIKTLLDLGYKVDSKLLDATDFGVAQRRKRVYIAGHREHQPSLDGFEPHQSTVADCIDHHAPHYQSTFTNMLNSKFNKQSLYGKAIKDKRGGKNNIHSWDLELKGKVSAEQKKVLDTLLKIRRYKQWAEAKGIDWMDGMPLTLNEIKQYIKTPQLKTMLDDLVNKGYLKFEHPREKRITDGRSERVPNVLADKGYNIVSGKLSFPITKILDPLDFCPTIVATEAGKIAVATDAGVRPITVLEGLRLSGFPNNYSLNHLSYRHAFDLIGNTVMPPVIKAVCERLIR